MQASCECLERDGVTSGRADPKGYRQKQIETRVKDRMTVCVVIGSTLVIAELTASKPSVKMSL